MFFASHVSKNKLSFDLDQHVIYMIFIHVIYLWQQIGFFESLPNTLSVSAESEGLTHFRVIPWFY